MDALGIDSKVSLVNCQDDPLSDLLTGTLRGMQRYGTGWLSMGMALARNGVQQPTSCQRL